MFTVFNLKVSEFYMCTRQPFPYDDTKRLTDLALLAFGPERMMWGSDFPPVRFPEGYHNTLAFGDRIFPDLSEEGRVWLIGRTADRVWQFSEQNRNRKPATCGSANKV